jgi:intein/homing endonuclease
MSNLTKEQVLIEYVKCQRDNHYALKTYLQTYDNTVSKYVPLELFPDQISLLNDYENHNENIALKYRQAGVSTVTAAWISKKLAFAKKTKPEKILIIANKLDTSLEMANKIRSFVGQWPNWVGVDFSSEKNSQKHYRLNNGCEVKAVATSKDALRGFTPTILVFDEAAFIEADSDFWAACMASLSTGGKVIVISTPNGHDPIYYEIYDQSLRNMNDFKISEMYWYRDPRYAKDLYFVKTDDIVHYLLNKEEYTNQDIISWTDIPNNERNLDEVKELLQKGYKPCSTWFEAMVKKLKYDKRKVSQELECNFLGSGDNVFDSKLMQNIKENMLKEPQNRMVSNSLWIWKEPVLGHKYVMGCLPPNEKVLTDSGLKNIEDVELKDKLVSENGDYVNIINKQIYPVVNEKIFEVKMDNTFRTTTFTKEHPILISKPKLRRNYNKNHEFYLFNERYWDFDFNYKRMEEVEVGDWVRVPNIYKKSISNIFEDKWVIKENIRIDFKIESSLNDVDFWWFIGMWLGDGWLGKRKDSYTISLCFDKKHTSYIEKAEELIKRLFNRSPSFIDKGKTYELVFNSKFLYYFILENFGQYSYGKKISEWVKFIPNEHKKELIRGYFDSDGCWVKTEKNNKVNSKVSFVSINLELLESFQDIIFSLGIISSLNKLRGDKKGVICDKIVQQKQTYNLCLGNYDSLELIKLIYKIDDEKLNKFNINEFSNINKRIISSCHFDKNKDFIYFKIKAINEFKFTGDVYNFECDSHTFMCHHITTHNCDVSRGDSEDYSAFQIIDFDEREQVAEFVGKLPPDTMAEICYKWGGMYNAFIVIDITGGMGVSTSRKLQEMGYKDLYVDGVDTANKWKYDPKALEKIPGINFNNKRVQIIASYEEVLRHGFRIYSNRLYNEMDSFVYINGRPDHQKGRHDDLIMSIAMATYVAESSFASLTKVTEHTKAMIDSWSVSVNEQSREVLNFNPVIPNNVERIRQFGSQNISKEDYQKYGWLFGVR